MVDDSDSLGELKETAKIVAEATGRGEAEVLADLLDDGIVNLSNDKSCDKDLVTQLQEAAELITTVQSINQEVSENTVLNGGENKTEVLVESTLEGDIVDRAIASVHRKAENIKKIAIIFIPIFLILTGGTMEGMGLINWFGSDDMSEEDIPYLGGCTEFDAENYNDEATWDDGTCYWDAGGNTGGGGGPPITIYGCTDVEADNYDEGANTDDGSCEYIPKELCEVLIENHYRGHVEEDEEQDAILITFKVRPNNCDGETINKNITLFQNGYSDKYTQTLTVIGDEDANISYIYDDVAIGTSWTPKITASVNDEQLEQVFFLAIDIEAQELETCEINLFNYGFTTNNTHASVSFDLDCGYETNNLSGYNVTVQFLVYELNGTNSGDNATGPIIYEVCIHYIEGWVADINYLTLTNFTASNSTHYDFYWYAMWTNANGEQQIIEEKWLNRELNQ